ncbi:MAG: choice-of-anchor Q domain-containing protein, partial [Nevskiales bacterium]
ENTAAADDDLSASGFFAMNSLINNPGASTGSGFFISGRSALLNELADYGGPTLTRALDRGSPAVDGGDPNVCADLNANKDQRGQLRTVDADNDGNLTCDMGAFEFNGRSVNCDAVPLPAMSCKAALKGSLSIVDNAGTASDSMTLALTSLNTPSTTFFGNPTHFNGTANAVCVYVNTVAMMAPDRLIGSLNVPAGERNSKGLTPWTLTSAGKTSYSLSTGNIDGLTRLTQTPSSSMTTTTGSVLAAAKGNAFTVPAIPLMTPSALTVTVQNVTSGGACAEISFTGAEIKTFTFNRFTASQ